MESERSITRETERHAPQTVTVMTDSNSVVTKSALISISSPFFPVSSLAAL